MERVNLTDLEPSVSGAESLTTQDEHRADKARMYRTQAPLGSRGLSEVVIKPVEEELAYVEQEEGAEE